MPSVILVSPKKVVLAVVPFDNFNDAPSKEDPYLTAIVTAAPELDYPAEALFNTTWVAIDGHVWHTLGENDDGRFHAGMVEEAGRIGGLEIATTPSHDELLNDFLDDEDIERHEAYFESCPHRRPHNFPNMKGA